MSYPVPIPIDLYQRLTAVAAEHGKTAEDFLIALATDAVEAEAEPEEEIDASYDPAKDPLLQIAGMFTSGIPDIAANHDKYLAEGYADDHDPTE